ncbi:MAG: acylphosphatase [Dehalococcoidales bacterium]|nr:acylphosphatase [Dehalococcoidales bacterium]
MNVKTTGKIERRHITITGVVQGVGFRPFVYRLARENKLNGSVRNTSGSLEIDVEGPEARIQSLLSGLSTQPPPMARIEHISQKTLPVKGYPDFRIVESQPQAGEYQLVSPDIATCPDCL